MPPLEVEDFPQVGYSEMKMPLPDYGANDINIYGSRNNNETSTDILQEILSVAHASQELINQTPSYSHTSWGGHNNNENYAPQEGDDQDFTFMVGGNNSNNYDSHVSYRTWEDPNTVRSIEIGDVDEFKGERMVENLRWVGMSSKYMDKVC